MCARLRKEEQYQFLKLLQKYERLFFGTLRQFYLYPISLHAADKGVKPVHARPYTYPRDVEQQLRTEIAKLVDIGVLQEDNTIESVSLTSDRSICVLGVI
jgi:hypothetical protein